MAAIGAFLAVCLASCDWEDIDEIPAGFADGIDNDTVVTPGPGLTETGGVIEADFEGSGGDLGSLDNVARSDHLHDATYWRLEGNAGTTAGTDFLGTTDDQPLELRVNGARALRLEPYDPASSSPNVVAGHESNAVTAGAFGAVIGGGGYDDGGTVEPNRVTDNCGTVSGGIGNVAGDGDGDPTSAQFSTVGGGEMNAASGQFSTVGGGRDNVAGTLVGGGDYATVGGGDANTASGEWSTVNGGRENIASAWYATVGGGWLNEANGTNAVVAGGSDNQASSSYATVGGGDGNTAAGSCDCVAGGVVNFATGGYASIGGGVMNAAGGMWSSVAGGNMNSAQGQFSAVPGGDRNQAAGDHSFAAGRRAKALDDGAFVWADSTDADFASTGANQFLIRASGGVGIGTNAPASALDVVGTVTATGLTIPTDANPSYVLTSDAGGNATWAPAVGGPAWGLLGNAGTTAGTNFLGTTDNVALELHVNAARALRIVPETDGPSILGGHPENYIEPGAYSSTISGGGAATEANRVYDSFGTIGGGRWNQAGVDDGGTGSQMYGTVGGGYGNYALNIGATVAGGITNFASGNFAAIPGGHENSASGDFGLAAGRRAKADHAGSFVWADSSDAYFASTADNEFSVRCVGGTRIVTAIDGTGAPTAGVSLAPGGTSWGTISDRNVKKGIEPVDGEAILGEFARLDIPSWHYAWEGGDDPRHMGPMAQDFHAAFGLGADDKVITTQDADGVALAAIKALERRTRELRAENTELRARIARLEKMDGDRSAAE